MNLKVPLPDEYERECGPLRELGPRVEQLVGELLGSANLRTHSVTHRVKDLSSVERKLSVKSAAYDSLSDITDLLGVRVITFFPDEVDLVADIIESEFSIDQENSVDKRELLDPDRFGYLSLHYVATLSERHLGLPEYSRFEGVTFEIQIRSILQHAWAEIEHDLGYHSAGAIPDSIRRRFSRLAGLLEIADVEFETLRNESRDYRDAVAEEVDTSPESIQIDRDSIYVLVTHSESIKGMDRELAQILDAEIGESGLISAGLLAFELRWLGLKTIAEVTASFENHKELVREFVVGWSKRVSPDQLMEGVSLFYLAYLLASEDGSLSQVSEYLTAANISGDAGEGVEEIAREIIDVTEAAKASVEGGQA